MVCYETMDNLKIQELKSKLTFYEDKLRLKMRWYRGVIHESAASEMKHQEVMVLRAMVEGIKQELDRLSRHSLA